jgi:predicted permease
MHLRYALPREGSVPGSLEVTAAVLSVFSVMGAGALLRRIEWLTAEADDSLMNLSVRLLMPCLILDTVAGNPRLAGAANLALPPLVGFLELACGITLAAGIAGLLGGRVGLGDARRRHTFALTAGVQNYGYLPIPLARLLFDDGTLGVLMVHNVGVELALWTVGVFALTGGLGGGLRRAVNPPSIAVVLGLGLNALGLGGAIPGFLRQALALLGEAAIPLAVLLVGATVADHFSPAALRGGAATIGVGLVLRLLALPALFLLAALTLPLTPELRRVLVLQAAMPAALFPVVMVRYYGGEAATALRVVLGSSLVSLLTTPLWLGLGLRALALP